MKIVDFNTAKTLQELGYDGEYTDGYASDGELTGSAPWIAVPAPRLDDAAYWIRDKYQLSIEVGITMCRCWSAYIYDYSQEDVTGALCEIYDDYDSALESAVIKAIEIIKTKKK